MYCIPKLLNIRQYQLEDRSLHLIKPLQVGLQPAILQNTFDITI